MSYHDKPKNDLETMMSKRDYGIKEVRGIGGILAGLWRSILFERGVPYSRLEQLMTDFIINAHRFQPENRISKFLTRGNLRREFEKPTMTFKVFMKGLKVLKVKKVRFAVELTYESNKTSLHSTTIDLGHSAVLELTDQQPHLDQTHEDPTS